jgi:hypothetical protein
MSDDSEPKPSPPTWTELWFFGACWAGRPVPGVILPKEERTKAMTQVMNEFMVRFDEMPSVMQSRGFIQQRVVRVALEATRAARLATGNPSLWHDESHRGTTPVLDLTALQSDPKSQVWQTVLTQMRPRALGYLLKEGISETDGEDIFAEAVASIVRERSDGSRALDEILVYEQFPPFVVTVVKRRMLNFLRDRGAAKRSRCQTVSLHEDEEALRNAEREIAAGWAAEENDPLRGLTLERLSNECAHCLTALQLRILTELYITESASYMEVARSPWFIAAAGVKGASDATRRRALDHEHATALDKLAECLGIPRNGE